MNKTCIAAIALIGTLLVASMPARAADFGDCHVGAYRLPDGTVMDIAPSSDRLLRWRRFDGTTGALTESASGAWTSTAGWTEKPDGIEVRFQCADNSLSFGSETARRIPLAVTESRFDAGGTALVGRLVLPPGKGRVPIVVLVHGSEDSSARTFYSMQRLLPARGVGVYVYDKRGTGESGGTYTQDFERLADDAVAALHEARRLAGKRAGRIGYLGTSQGGWVAPLAARREAPDFVIVAYGLAVSVIDEDREAIELEMGLKGHSPDEIAKALEVASAAEAVFESRFTSAFAELLAARAKYEHESWYPDLQGNFTHFILGMDETQLRATAQTFGTWGTPFRYDPMPTLRALHVPQLWVLGEADLDAPSAETARRLRGLADAGQKISIAMFPGAEHGITEFEIAADGTRVSTRYAPGYFEILRAFALDGQVRGTFGRARISRP